MSTDISAQTILEWCRHTGTTMQLDGEQIKVTAPQGIPSDIREAIRAHKPALVAHLKSVRPTEDRDRGDVPRCPNCHLASVILGDGSIRPCECGGVPA